MKNTNNTFAEINPDVVLHKGMLIKISMHGCKKYNTFIWAKRPHKSDALWFDYEQIYLLVKKTFVKHFTPMLAGSSTWFDCNLQLLGNTEIFEISFNADDPMNIIEIIK